MRTATRHVAAVIGPALILLASFASPATAWAQRPEAGTAASDRVPTRGQWIDDIHHILAHHHARRYIKRRADHGDRLALNLDIDNTVRATYYGGGAIPEMLALTRFAHRHHVAVFFNTGRASWKRERTRDLLDADGFRYGFLCMRRAGEAVVHGKLRCRRKFHRAGWTLIENIGNTAPDLAGKGYGRGIMLPNYGTFQ